MGRQRNPIGHRFCAVYLPVSVAEHFEALARQNGTSRSAEMRRCLCGAVELWRAVDGFANTEPVKSALGGKL